MDERTLHSLHLLIEPWSQWMWTMSMQLAALVIVLLILDRLLRNRSARLRHVLWTLVLVRLLLPPDFAAPTSLNWWIGEHVVSWADNISIFGEDGRTADSSQPIASDVNTLAVHANGQHASDMAESKHPNSPSAGNLHIGNQQTGSVSWSLVFFLLWQGIVAARLTLLVYAFFQVRKWLRASTAITDPRILFILHSAKEQSGYEGDIGLSDSRSCMTPLVTGWWSPVILLPTHVRTTLSDSELETVLVHELTHVQRGDGWTRLIQALLSSFYFFHPALWLANRFITRTCEEACDEQTIVALSGKRRSYAEAIFKSAAAGGYEPPHLALGMLGTSHPVKRRLERILDPKLQFHAGGTGRRLVVALILALVLLPSGLPQSTAKSPDRVIVDTLRNSTEPVADSSSRDSDGKAASMPSLAASTESAQQVETGNEIKKDTENTSDAIQREQYALSLLESIEMERRMEGYALLEELASPRTLAPLEVAFLLRSGIEQDAAKRALDAVWIQIRRTAIPSASTARFYQAPSEN